MFLFQLILKCLLFMQALCILINIFAIWVESAENPRMVSTSTSQSTNKYTNENVSVIIRPILKRVNELYGLGTAIPIRPIITTNSQKSLKRIAQHKPKLKNASTLLLVGKFGELFTLGQSQKMTANQSSSLDKIKILKRTGNETTPVCEETSTITTECPESTGQTITLGQTIPQSTGQLNSVSVEQSTEKSASESTVALTGQSNGASMDQSTTQSMGSSTNQSVAQSTAPAQQSGDQGTEQTTESEQPTKKLTKEDLHVGSVVQDHVDDAEIKYVEIPIKRLASICNISDETFETLNEAMPDRLDFSHQKIFSGKEAADKLKSNLQESSTPTTLLQNNTR